MVGSVAALLGGVLAFASFAGGGAPSPAAGEIVAAFQSLCGSGDPSPEAVLARADAKGWIRNGQDMRGLDPRRDRVRRTPKSVLFLHAATSATAGEKQDTCGVSIHKAVEGLVPSTAGWLGFSPSPSFDRSATFFAVRNQEKWRSGAALDRAAFKLEKEQGRFYSIVALTGGDSVSLMWLRAYPADSGARAP